MQAIWHLQVKHKEGLCNCSFEEFKLLGITLKR
jgi:hypothetical protein